VLEKWVWAFPLGHTSPPPNDKTVPKRALEQDWSQWNLLDNATGFIKIELKKIIPEESQQNSPLHLTLLK